MPDYRIVPLEVSQTYFDKSHLTYLLHFGEEITSSCVSWYIEGAKENILVDTGAPASVITKGGFRGRDIKPITELLKERLNLTPDDIDIVIYTHLHGDHCGNSWLFKNARHIVQEDELRTALNPHPFLKQHYNVELIKHINFEIVNGDKEIVEGISVILSPGHTPAGQSVLIDTSKGKAVIVGFCSINENFDPPERFKPFLIPGIHSDPIKLYETGIKLKEMADIIIPPHEEKLAKKEKLP